MEARRIIESSAREPQNLAVIFQAFDLAWIELADTLGDDARSIEEARTNLAYACLIVSREGCDDAERIKLDALQVMGIAYRHRL